MDGISDCPGEPWDTSIPRIRVGIFETTGIVGCNSPASIELTPPSWQEEGVNISATKIYRS